MIIVTGAAGFIGSHLIKKLNSQGYTDLVLVDNLKDGSKFLNIKNANFEEYWDVDEFFGRFKNWYKVKAVYHQGAITNLDSIDGKTIMHYNYRFSIDLIDRCKEYHIPISYASSANVYGNSKDATLDPLNLYAYSKTLVDQHVIKIMNKTKLIHGWRYYNVYGSGDEHKGLQASVLTQFKNQALENGKIEIFEGFDKIYGDFIFVNDVIEIITNYMQKEERSGIRNLGTGRITSLKDVAMLISRKYGGSVVTVPFPNKLKANYQSHTYIKDHPDFAYTSIADWLMLQ